jgi:two-component system phosphate regulon sensor histidine kinase PhoR
MNSWPGRLRRARVIEQAAAPNRVSQPEKHDPSSELLAHVEDGLLVCHAGQVRWVNPAAIRMFAGLATPAGRPLMEFVRDHRIEAIAIRAAERGMEEAAEIEQAVSGRVLYVRGLPLASGVVALIVRDITRLRQLETVRQQFVANLAHEMRTPLTGLDLVAETLLGMMPSTGEQRKLLLRLQQEWQRLQSMLSNLTLLASLDDRGVRMEPVAFDLGRLAEELVLRNQPQAKRQGLKLRTELVGGEPEAWADRTKTDQALQAIIDNALKFTSAGEVLLITRADAGRVEVAVRDTGRGIPARELPRIFERFYKVDPSHGESGSGLGLSIARHLVELQGGTIVAESTPGIGTEVRVRLPRPPLTSR